MVKDDTRKDIIPTTQHAEILNVSQKTYKFARDKEDSEKFLSAGGSDGSE